MRHTFSGFFDGRKPDNIAMVHGIYNFRTNEWTDVGFLNRDGNYIANHQDQYKEWDHGNSVPPQDVSPKEAGRCMQDYKKLKSVTGGGGIVTPAKWLIQKDAVQDVGDKGWVS